MTPVTTPEAFTVATALLLLVQVPPEGEEDKVEVAPAQKASEPEKAAGAGLTVIFLVVLHPFQ
jgi:hypothetical protein